MNAAFLSALLAGAAFSSVNAAFNATYKVGDFLTLSDRAVKFAGCDGTKYSLGSFLDAGTAVVLDKSKYT